MNMEIANNVFTVPGEYHTTNTGTYRSIDSLNSFDYDYWTELSSELSTVIPTTPPLPNTFSENLLKLVPERTLLFLDTTNPYYASEEYWYGDNLSFLIQTMDSSGTRFGSGFFCEINDKIYICTVGHVVKTSQQNSGLLFNAFIPGLGAYYAQYLPGSGPGISANGLGIPPVFNGRPDMLNYVELSEEFLRLISRNRKDIHKLGVTEKILETLQFEGVLNIMMQMQDGRKVTGKLILTEQDDVYIEADENSVCLGNSGSAITYTNEETSETVIIGAISGIFGGEANSHCSSFAVPSLVMSSD